MNYKGQEVNVTILKNQDEVALANAIKDISQEIVDIKYTSAKLDNYVVEYSALIITK